MKKLESLNIARLSNLEFGQHTKSIYTNLKERNGTAVTITDTIFGQYLVELNLKNLTYDKAMVQIAKSDETIKIAKADANRDKELICMYRYLTVFEFSSDDERLSAHASLNTLFDKYRGMQEWNYEKQTNGIDNLIADLESDRYQSSVDLLGMTTYVTAVKTSNNNFKTLFNGRTVEAISKEVFDVKELKKDLKDSYTKTIEYVLSMARALDNTEFNESLIVINSVRKYYSDMLARRNGTHSTTPEVTVT